MGVVGLWDLIRPAAVRTSLQALARDAFMANRNGLRAFTIGVDASIWIFHAQTTHAGSNPFLRTIFYRIAALLQHPVLPVFVFGELHVVFGKLTADGPKKPNMKRNRNVAGRFGVNDAYSMQFKQLLDVCGLEWWNAPGEAEAELALMNRQGKIDAVLSDDVDALLFGAKCLLRNNSPTLSGAQASAMPNSSSKSELRHYEMYRIRDIAAEWTEAESALQTEEDCRMAMVFTALLSGGDYIPEGVGRMGPTISMGLAKAGCADFLKLYAKERSAFDRRLADVHDQIVHELQTNSTKHIGRRYKKSAEDIAKMTPRELFQTFPLDSYLCPATSDADDPSKGWPGFGKGDAMSGRGMARNAGRGDLEGMARACERYFEWGTRELVCKKFASDSVNLFGAEIVAEARHRVRKASPPQRHTLRAGESPERITSYFSQSTTRRITTKAGTSTTHLVKIHSKRTSPLSTPKEVLEEYRLEYRTEGYIARCHEAMEGSRADPSSLSEQDRAKLGMVAAAGATDTTVKDEIRIWIAEYLVAHAWPELVTAYKEEEAAKEAKKAASQAKTKSRKAAPKKKVPSQASGENADAFRGYFTNPPPTQSAVREVEGASQRKGPAAATQSPPSPSPSATSSDLTPAPTPAPSSPDVVAVAPPSPTPTPPMTPSKRSRPSKKALSACASSSSISSESATEVAPTPTRHRSPRKRPTPERVPPATSTPSGLSADDAISLISDDEDTPRPLRLSFLPNSQPEETPTRNHNATKTGKQGTQSRGLATAPAPVPVHKEIPLPPSRQRAAVTPAPQLSSGMPTPPATRQRDESTQRTAAPVSPETVCHREPTARSTDAPRVATSQPRQTLLDKMVIARPRKAATAAPKPPPIPACPDHVPAHRVPYFVLTQDTDGVEHIDLTVPRPRQVKRATPSA